MGAGGFMMGMGSFFEGMGSYDAGHRTQTAYRASARAAQREGREAKRLSNYQVRLIEESGAEVLGGIEAETGKSGLALTGTPLATLVDNARKVELSAELERRSGRITERRWEEEAAGLRQAGSDANQAGKIGMVSSFFGGAARIYGQQKYGGKA